jgi:hypothetical protein
LPKKEKEKKTEEWVMPGEIFTVYDPSGSSGTQKSDDEILGEVPVSNGKSRPPQLPDVGEADWSGNGGKDPVVSPGPDVTTRNDVGYFQSLYVSSIASGAVLKNLKSAYLASLRPSYVPLAARGSTVRIICDALRNSPNPNAAHSYVYRLRMTTDPNNTNQALAQAEHYLWAYSFVKSGSLWWGPMHVANLGWHLLKMTGLASGAEPTSDLLSSGYLGANDALFGNTVCSDIVYFK